MKQSGFLTRQKAEDWFRIYREFEAGRDEHKPILTEHGANCPICGTFFNQDHAFRKPQYCENCGCRLKWEEL